MDYDVRVQHYWRNWLLCWHGKENRRLFKSNNGVVSYCDVCKRKQVGIHDFGFARFN